MVSDAFHSLAGKKHLGLDLVLYFTEHCGFPQSLYQVSLLRVQLPFTVWVKSSKSVQTGLMRMLLILKIRIIATC